MADSQYRGVVRHSDIAGGAWTLVTDAGVVYQLDGGDAKLKTDGIRVVVDGEIADGQMGIAMVGDILRVKSYKVVDA
ncbi:MAG: hypothetical protein H6707_19185 [Deltaproteobacteria bacterium]|nr:hypothetical protein [Deltaproteobacteria bacterium]